MTESSNPRYEFGPFVFDPAEQLLLRDGEPISLTPKAVETLRQLIQNSGHVVGKDELLKNVWPDTYVEEGNLTVNISMLRKILGEAQNGQQYIETVPRRGYRFVAGVRELRDADIPSPHRGARAAKFFPTKELPVKGRVEAFAESGGADAKTKIGKSYIDPTKRTNISASIVRSAQTEKKARKVIDTLAVLPLANASADPNADYLSDGITESIINSLSQLPHLRVMARSTVFRYKGLDVHPQEAGRELGVRFVLTGRVLQLGDSLVIRTELVDVNDGWQMWGEQYNRRSSDILAVQEEISRDISEKLRQKLSGEQKRRLNKRPTESTEAYRAYLRGRYYWNKRTLGALKKGVEFFEQAIAIDSNYALAYVGLADSYLLLGSSECGALHPSAAMGKAKEAATTALMLDGTLAEAHTSLAYSTLFDWNWAETERAYRRAIELNSSYPTAHHWYALYLTAMGRRAEAMTELKRALDLDPLSLPINLGVGLHHHMMRDYDRAVEEYSKTLEMDLNFYMAHLGIGMAYEQLSRFNDAIAEYEKAIRISGRSPFVLAGIGHASAILGQTEKARKILDELNQQTHHRYVSPYLVAVIHTGLDDKDAAFRCLQQACETRAEELLWLQVDPMFDSLRNDLRFADLLRYVRLAD